MFRARPAFFGLFFRPRPESPCIELYCVILSNVSTSNLFSSLPSIHPTEYISIILRHHFLFVMQEVVHPAKMIQQNRDAGMLCSTNAKSSLIQTTHLTPGRNSADGLIGSSRLAWNIAPCIVGNRNGKRNPCICQSMPSCIQSTAI